MNILYYTIFIHLLVSFTLSYQDSVFERSKLYTKLNRQLRNAVCCVNKMKCCNHSMNSENISIRAVLLRCANVPGDNISTLNRKLNKPLSPYREDSLRKFQGFDDDELVSDSVIKNCRKKLALTIKISNIRLENSQSKYIVIDHVYDTFTKKNARLITPYVVKIKQEPVMQAYQLKFLHVVNSLAQEEVLNKHSPNYTGCDTTSNTPTCGKITYMGKVIPFSEGFCCSCDAVVNTKRQPQSINPYVESIISYSDPAFLLDGVECPRNLRGREITNETREALRRSKRKATKLTEQLLESLNRRKKDQYCNTNTTRVSSSTPLYTKSNSSEYLEPLFTFLKHKTEMRLITDLKGNAKRVKKRQVLPSGVQRRGGQNCADRFTPKGLNPNTYHESAHCLRFSDLWYTVYHLQQPVLEQSILFQVFEKMEDVSGTVAWRDLTNGTMVRVGTIIRQFIDPKQRLSITYHEVPPKVDKSLFSINYKSALLLIPEGLHNCKVQKYPELNGGPPEYLIVDPTQISMDGDQCNVAGVGFEGFVKQSRRCSRPKSACLANQPYHLWKHDHEAEKTGKRGCFFLKHFGKLPKNPIRRHPDTGQQFLVLEYSGHFSALIDLEIRADFNTVLRPFSSARITEVYVDSTSSYKTVLTVKITNSGLASSSFLARLSDCPIEISAGFSNIETGMALIPPQHQHVFVLELKCPLPADRFHCSVEALNSKRELVALRRIRLQKFDRCICTWHCLCACVGSSEGLKCIPMSLQHYHAAGFQGALPINTLLVHYTFLDDTLLLILYILISLILLLLLLGSCKAIIGILCFEAIGQWGLDVILDLPRPIKKYYESNLTQKKVYYDGRGWPIHPETGRRTRSVAIPTEMCLNVIFFFLYPTYIFMTVLKKLFCPRNVTNYHSSGSVCISTNYQISSPKNSFNSADNSSEDKSLMAFDEYTDTDGTDNVEIYSTEGISEEETENLKRRVINRSLQAIEEGSEHVNDSDVRDNFKERNDSRDDSVEKRNKSN